MAKYFFIITILLFSINIFAQEERVIWPSEYEPSKSKFYVHNEIEIDATPQVVWEILIDALKWESYYEGAKNVSFVNPNDKVLNQNSVMKWQTMGLKFESTIKEFEPTKLLAWESKKKQIQGYHVWLIIPTEKGCKVITDESQNGWLTFFEKTFQGKKLKKLHDIWLKAIKERAEGNKSTSSLNTSSTNEKIALTMNERIFLTQQLNESLSQFDKTIKDLNSAQLNFRISENTWTIAECIEHVTLAELRFPAIVQEELQKLPNPEMRKKIRLTDEKIIARLTNRNGRAKSPEILKPFGKYANSDEAIGVFRKQRLQTIDYVNSTNDDLHNHFWRHPATGIIDLYQTIILMSAHLQRHLAQIVEIKSNQNFPKV